VPSVIECEGLTKFYGKSRGVIDLSLSVEAGTAYGFLGPNGAGKTTTIRCILGMLKPTAGGSRLFGEHVKLDGADLRRRIGYVAGEVHLYDRETGRWHIDYISGLRGRRSKSDAALMERLDFDPSKRVKELSKGNKQKLALLLGLMHDPELLLLDEPTSGLDPLNQQTVFEILEERMRDGATLFLSSHILPEVERMCERVAIIREGRLVVEQDVTGLLARRVRDLEVTFAEPTDADFLDGLPGLSTVEQRNAHSLRATVKGEELNALLSRLAEREVCDLEITRASLEDVFVEYYRESDEPVADEAVAVDGGGAQ
jgi:ABC-2 type transport system ATP-binding protein